MFFKIPLTWKAKNPIFLLDSSAEKEENCLSCSYCGNQNLHLTTRLQLCSYQQWVFWVLHTEGKIDGVLNYDVEKKLSPKSNQKGHQWAIKREGNVEGGGYLWPH